MNYTPINVSALKQDAKMRVEGIRNTFHIATAIMLICSVLSGMSRTEWVNVAGEWVQLTSRTPFSSAFSFLVAPVLTVGAARFYLTFLKSGDHSLEDFKYAFNNYGRCLAGMLWMNLCVFLWSLLLVIPGIIKLISFSMTPYILADNPYVGFREGTKISAVLTDGRKWDVVKVALSFLGWLLLTALTFGIAGFYVMPWYDTAMAMLYETLKYDAISQGRIDASVFDSSTYANTGLMQ